MAEKRAKIAHLEAAVANAEHAVEAYEKTPLAQAVCAAACLLSAWCLLTRCGMGWDGWHTQVVAVWEMLVREMLTEVAFAVHRSLATAATAKDAAEGKDKGNAEGNDEDDDDDDEAAVPAPRRGVPGPGPNSRTVCPNCQRGVPCSRFTLHLDKCLAHPGTRRTKQSARF